MESGINTRAFLGQFIIGCAKVLAGQSRKEVAAELVRRLACKWCAEGWPFDASGSQHDVLGIIVPCEANGAGE